MGNCALMLTIREEQIAILSKRQQSQISIQIAADLRHRFLPIFQYYSDEQLQRWVKKQIDLCSGLNITGKQNVLDCIDFFAYFGERFERCDDPNWALEILENKSANEDIRVEKIKRKSEHEFRR